MAVAYKTAIAGTDSASSATATVSLAALAAGDLVFVHLRRADSTAAPSNAPAGWTYLGLVTNVNASFLYAKVIASGDLGDATWTWDAAKRVHAVAVVYTGHHPLTPVSQIHAGSPGAGGGGTIPLGSFVSPLAMLVQFASGHQSTYEITWTQPEGYTERYEGGSLDSDQWVMVSDTNGAWGGGNSNPTMTASESVNYRMFFQVSINPDTGPLIRSPAYGSITTSNASAPYDDVDFMAPERLAYNDRYYGYITSSSFDTDVWSYRVICKSFGFSIAPGATIDGVKVELDSYYATATFAVGYIKLLDGDGAAQGDSRHADDGNCASTDSANPDTLTFGGAAEKWGATLTPAVVNDADWGLEFALQAKGNNCDAYIDGCRVTVYYTEAGGGVPKHSDYYFRRRAG